MGKYNSNAEEAMVSNNALACVDEGVKYFSSDLSVGFMDDGRLAIPDMNAEMLAEAPTEIKSMVLQIKENASHTVSCVTDEHCSAIVNNGTYQCGTDGNNVVIDFTVDDGYAVDGITCVTEDGQPIDVYQPTLSSCKFNKDMPDCNVTVSIKTYKISYAIYADGTKKYINNTNHTFELSDYRFSKITNLEMGNKDVLTNSGALRLTEGNYANAKKVGSNGGMSYVTYDLFTRLKTINYNGTKADWGALGVCDKVFTIGVTIHCTDGDIVIAPQYDVDHDGNPVYTEKP